MTTDQSTTSSAGVTLSGAGERIQLENIRKEFGSVTAVNNLTLEIHNGEFLVLLGPSGCGKTTTLRMIAGLETPTEGEIHIGSETVTRTLPQERDLSMVFQSYALYPHKTVRENLAFPLGKMDVDESNAESRIEHVADILEISDLLEKDPGQLSGGQRQRVALGRTIIREPRAFLMDEPLSNLDARLRVQTRAELRELQQDLGTTTVYVTHDQEEAMSLADRIAVMNDGEIQQVGSPREIYRQPINEFVAGFIGEPAMNFFSLVDDDYLSLFPAAPVRVEESIPDDTDTLGIRPEHIHLHDTAPENTSALTPPFECTLDVVEPLGNAYELELIRGDETFTVRQRSLSEKMAAADTVDVVFNADAVHAFDRDGKALLNGGETDE